jgi:hypothetical protein
MKTKDFIGLLRGSPDRALLFMNAEGHLIHSGYHLTEIKAANYDTVDCGGKKNRWNETILQLWVPQEADDDYMLTGKFVSIYDKVSKMVTIDQEAEVRIEYGDDHFLPTTYHVGNFIKASNSLRFVLEPPSTTCKARDRSKANAESCCC